MRWIYAIFAIAVLLLALISFSFFTKDGEISIGSEKSFLFLRDKSAPGPESFNEQTSNEVSSGSTGSEYSPTVEAAEEDRHYCSERPESCEGLQQEAVCGWYDLEQVTCDPRGSCVRGLFPNECEACMNTRIVYWTEGDCPLHW